jgi:hypothetical protein
MEKISPGPTSQTHPNGFGHTGLVGPAPRQTLIRSPAPTTRSRPHRRHSNLASSGGFRRRRMAQSLRAISFTIWPREVVSFSSVRSRQVELTLGVEAIWTTIATSALWCFIGLVLGWRAPAGAAGAAWRRSALLCPVLPCHGAAGTAPSWFRQVSPPFPINPLLLWD